LAKIVDVRLLTVFSDRDGLYRAGIATQALLVRTV
jgi:hypothetical protein